jgi:hypothetical protein
MTMTDPDLIFLTPAIPVRVSPEDMAALATSLRHAAPSANVRVSERETKDWTPPTGDTVWLWLARGADVLTYASVVVLPVVVAWLRARFRDPHTPPGAKMATLYKVDGTVLTSVRIADESADVEDSTDDARRSGPRPRPLI